MVMPYETEIRTIKFFFLVLRIAIGSLNAVLLIAGFFGTSWGIIGGLTLNVPPFDEESYVDHDRAPINFTNLLHFNPLTLIGFNGLAVLISSGVGLYSSIHSRVLTHLLAFALIASAFWADYMTGFSIYWEPQVMQILLGKMKDAMHNYQNMNNTRGGGLWLIPNATKYWDTIQSSRDCCGLNGFEDWEETSFYKTQNRSMPDSCCKITRIHCGREHGWRMVEFSEYGEDESGTIKGRGCLFTFPITLILEFPSYSLLLRILGLLMIISAGLSFFTFLLSICCSTCISYMKIMKRYNQRVAIAMDEEIEMDEIFFMKNFFVDFDPPPFPFLGQGDLQATPSAVSQMDPSMTEMDLKKYSNPMTPCSWLDRVRSNARRTICNWSDFLFPPTSSNTSYVRTIFTRCREKTENFVRESTQERANSVASFCERNVKLEISPYNSLVNDLAAGEPKLYESLEPRTDAFNGDLMIFPSLLSLPQRPSTTTLISRNCTNLFNRSYAAGASSFSSNFGFGDRRCKSTTSDKKDPKNSMMSTKTIYRCMASPSRNNKIHPLLQEDKKDPEDSMMSTKTIYRNMTSPIRYNKIYPLLHEDKKDPEDSMMSTKTIYRNMTSPIRYNKIYPLLQEDKKDPQDSMMSTKTMYQSSELEFEGGDGDVKSLGRMDSLEGHYISPSTSIETVDIFLNPMFGNSSSSSIEAKD